jgi:hypothetical protein
MTGDPRDAVISGLLERLGLLEAERDVRNVLALYCFYADHDMTDQWLDLFTEDAEIDTIMFVGLDATNPAPDEFRPVRLQGRDDLLHKMIKGPNAKSIEGSTQHHMYGPPARFSLVDASTAVIVSYAVVYAKPPGDTRPHVTYQSHTIARWTFRRVGSAWKIAEVVRRRMGHPDSAGLVAGFDAGQVTGTGV